MSAVPRVAMVTALNRKTPFLAVYDTERRTWREVASGLFCVDTPETTRPFVVIDPEDSDQVSTLVDAVLRNGYKFDGIRPGDLAAALRSLLTPDEPTDPKARVTDQRDNIWRLLADGDWVCTSGPDIGEYLAWPGLVDRGARVLPTEAVA